MEQLQGVRAAPDGASSCLQGYALEKLIAGQTEGQRPEQRVVAKVHLWKSHDQMFQLVKEAMSPS